LAYLAHFQLGRVGRKSFLVLFFKKEHFFFLTWEHTMRIKLAGAMLAMITPAMAQTFYVSEQAGGVTTLNGANFARSGQIDVGGQGPRGIAVTHDGKYLLTANQGSGDLSVIDRASGTLLARIPIGPSTEMVRAHGDTAYVTYEPPTDKGGLAHVAIVDLDKRVVTGSVPSGHETEGIEFSADGKTLLVANEGDDAISLYKLPDGSPAGQVKTAAYGTRPRGIKRSPDGSFYVATLEFSDKFLVLDKNFAVIKEVPTATGPYGLAFSPDGKRLFVAAAKAGLIQAFDAKTFAHLGDVKVGKRCWHFSFTQDGTRIVAACGRSDAVFVVDAAGLKLLQTINGFKTPWGVVAYPNAAGTLDVP
jgi:YVTN family beta-propeller protein